MSKIHEHRITRLIRRQRRRGGVIACTLATWVALTACSTGGHGGLKGMGPRAPDVDFYLMLDTSPSMEIAATSDGMASLKAATRRNENGCALGCHQSNPDHLGPFLPAEGVSIRCVVSGKYADGTTFSVGADFPYIGRDNFDLSRCLGAPLRIDLVRDAVQHLVTSAAETEKANHATYRMALFETDANRANPSDDLDLFRLQPMTGDLTPGGAAYESAGNIAALEVYRNNSLAKDDFNFDMDTYLDADLSSMNGLMPAPRRGAGEPGHGPREVLLIVTDGLNDETPRRSYRPMDWNGVICAAIKQKGVRIAVLYTTYGPTDDPWYLSQVAPALPKGLPPKLPSSTPANPDPMALAAQQCASPGLYEQVGTDGDIAAAMQTLFRRAISAGPGGEAHPTVTVRDPGA